MAGNQLPLFVLGFIYINTQNKGEWIGSGVFLALGLAAKLLRLSGWF
jgi:hypothetical protein